MTPRRALLEMAFVLNSIFVSIWIVAEMPVPWFRAAFLGVTCIGAPVLFVIRSQRHFPEFSLRWPGMVTSAQPILWFTLGATALLLVVRYICGRLNYEMADERQLLHRLFEYLAWAFAQQCALQLFLTRRMQAIFNSPFAVATAAALAFALIHWPNPVLVVFTFVGGVFWSWTFQRRPNLYALAWSHAWLAVMAFYCVPGVWLHGLRIGPSYWR